MISFLVNSILLGVGLAMDAFSVSIANGLNEPGMSRKKSCGIAGVYAAFQFLMPMTGWFCVHTIAEYFMAFQKFIPWIALLLLAYIGGKMLLEGIRNMRRGAEENEADTERDGQVLGMKLLLVQGIATSIDALSVGFTIADYSLLSAVGSSFIIGGVTFLICMLGLRFGRKFGEKLSDKAAIVGGLILIAIGIEIFVKGVF
ncbi:MAG: manganese efflux pump MntP family protein [Eubacteriales bacterium]|nr:manganese efflux pump MntP family protein [Eubacteriales bacterium]